MTFANEKLFLKAVKAAAKERSWHLHHETYSMGSVSGYPDLTLCHADHGVLWLELKVKETRSKTYPKQVEWRDKLQAAGQKAFIVYPKDYDNIIRLLDGLDVIEDVERDNNDEQLEIEL